MGKENNINKTWKGKLLDQYRMIIVNEKTFEEQFYFRLSRLNLIILLILLISSIMAGTFFLISSTPVKEFIPGYPSSELRLEAIKNTFLLDSIIDVTKKQDKFLESIRSALLGENDETIIEEYKPQISQAERDEYFVDQVKEDSILRDRVIQEDKYNFTRSSQTNLIDLLFPPAKGEISQSFDPDSEHYGIDIALSENSPVKSILDGRVIFAEWTSETGNVLIIKHSRELTSIYKHNASLFKKQGDLVSAGEVIATAGNTGKFSTATHLHFELWLSGYAVNPIDFINFSWK
jgi:murein DD-endopeptidase MepM/ murein hydrolase activator NlpD